MLRRSVPAGEWDAPSHWAPGVRQMFPYFEAHTYFGPDATSKVTLAKAITVKPFTNFEVWAAANMPVIG